MAVKAIPDGYHTVTPYIVVKGAAKLIDFLKQAFGAELIEKVAQPDGTVMHAAMKIGDSIVMMGEPHGEIEPMPATIYLYVNDTDATYKRALEAGATSTIEPVDQFYGDRNAGVKDPFGNHWWIATHQEDVSSEELKKRSEAHMKKS